jgi:DNA polymerase-3 subunit gamma/tau
MSKSLLEKYKVNSFEDILGQKNNINFLRNSLFKNIFYPLYLFSGMRGSGKTTSARLFSASLLCYNLKSFQASPKDIAVPCYECQSCLLYSKNQHPDIIELDAASHTGVDTIRSIIDNAYMLPIISEKKVYIIDEVHMLSKAAFNACLKIMEEPPKNVHFILATTELHKVIETIRSRSIILHYKPIATDILASYLKKIMDKEEIKIDQKAIELVCALSEGSVRDSLNILNRMMLIDDRISQEMIVEEYGIVENNQIEKLVDAILEENIQEYYQVKNSFSIAELGKKKLFEHAVLCIQDKLKIVIMNQQEKDIIPLKKILAHLYHYENFFYQSNTPLGIFDLLIGKQEIAETRQQSILDESPRELSPTPSMQIKKQQSAPEKHSVSPQPLDESPHAISINSEKKNLFLNNLDTVIKTIFIQGEIVINEIEKKIIINFKKNFSFYKTFLQNNEEIIQEAIKRTIGTNFVIEYHFIHNEKKIETEKTIPLETNNTKKINHIIPNNDIIKNKVRASNYHKNEENIIKNKKKVANLSPLLEKINNQMPGTSYYK